jgi:hypothetical protein
MDEAEIPCAECGRAVDEFTAIPERWGSGQPVWASFCSTAPSVLSEFEHDTGGSVASDRAASSGPDAGTIRQPVLRWIARPHVVTAGCG